MRFIHRHLKESALEIAQNPQRLFALAEWPALLDGTTLALIGVHYNLVVGSILQHGQGRDDLDDYLEELETMSSVGVFMVTELGYGTNAAALQTEASYDPQTREFVLNTPSAQAQKFMPYTGLTDIPKIAIVLARLKVGDTDHGVLPFIVRISDENGLRPGIRARKLPEKPGAVLDNGVTWFDHVRIPRRSLLSGKMGHLTDDGRFHSMIADQRTRFLHSIDRVIPGRLCLTGALVACARASTYIAIRYSHQRLTYAPGSHPVPTIAYRNHQRSLFGALASTYAMTLLVNQAKQAYAQADRHGAAAVNRLISVTKAVATWTATETFAECQQRCGAQGMFAVNRIAAYIGTAQGVATAEGDNTVLLSQAAGELITMPETTPPETIHPEDARLDDPAFLLSLLTHSEHTLHAAAKRRFKEQLRQPSVTAFDAWNSTINDALDLGRSHGSRLALSALMAAADKAATADAGHALRLLAALYGLQEVDKRSGWYLAHGVLRTEHITRISGTIDDLCAKILPYSRMLVDGFNLPNNVLRAPIAAENYLTRPEFTASPPDEDRGEVECGQISVG
ncbi:acyl-CoA dehydrogenase family protein [Streptomyces sp. 7N604]|uniref:acyl-CoA dehydrogenase family protein n=1 Tax=Streptomyces sp. 7N604 TaxID=3457415 RepID=UPI003FD253CC